MRSINSVVWGQSPHEVQTTIEDFEIDVFPLAIAIHPKNDEVDTLGGILQVLDDAALTRFFHHGGVE